MASEWTPTDREIRDFFADGVGDPYSMTANPDPPVASANGRARIPMNGIRALVILCRQARRRLNPSTARPAASRPPSMANTPVTPAPVWDSSPWSTALPEPLPWSSDWPGF